MSLIRAEYEFLKGNTHYWEVSGAAWNVVSNYCRRYGYGDFGKPTEKGQAVIEVYERDHSNE